MKVGNNVQIFLVENDPVQAQILIDKFTENNKVLNIKHFLSGEKLFTYLDENDKCSKKCYLLLDYFLQTEQNKDGLNGIDVIEKLQEKYHFIKIILYSAYEADDNLSFNNLVDVHDNIIGVVKKSDYGHSTLENIVRFDYINQIFQLKRRRFIITRNIFLIVLVISSVLLFITNFF